MSNSETWTPYELAGHVVDVYQPPRLHEHQFTVLYLHDQRERSPRELPGFVDQFQTHGLRVLMPRCGPTWWLDRVTPAFDSTLTPRAFVVHHVLPLMQQMWNVAPPQIAVLGYRMGGQGALALSYHYPQLFPVTAAITPCIDFQLLVAQGDEVLLPLYGDMESARQDTAILHVHPLNWPRHQFFCCDPSDPHWFTGADRLRMKLSSLGVPHVCDLQTTAATEWEYAGRMIPTAVEFLLERLEQERLRV